MSEPPALPLRADPAPPPPRLLDQLRQAALAHFGRPEPGQRFADWARRFIRVHGKRRPVTLLPAAWAMQELKPAGQPLRTVETFAAGASKRAWNCAGVSHCS